MRTIICFIIFIFISGCGEFAYKRGASAKDFDATKKTCQSAGNEAAIEKCLENNGWVVQKLDALGLPDSELFATASVNEDNRQTSQKESNQAIADQGEVTQSPTGQLETSPTEAISTTSRTSNIDEMAAKTKPTQNEVSTRSDEAKPVKKMSPNVVANTTKKESIPAINPFEKYKINSWWKMGGGRDALELSMSTCTKKLGDAHMPDRKNQIFTRAYAACMYENGWRGLREK